MCLKEVEGEKRTIATYLGPRLRKVSLDRYPGFVFDHNPSRGGDQEVSSRAIA